MGVWMVVRMMVMVRVVAPNLERGWGGRGVVSVVIGQPWSKKCIFRHTPTPYQPIPTVTNPYLSKTYLNQVTRALKKFVVRWGGVGGLFD